MTTTTPVWRCTKCGALKPLSSFYKDKRNRLGIQQPCKECRKIEHFDPCPVCGKEFRRTTCKKTCCAVCKRILARCVKYNISPATWFDIWNRQEGACGNTACDVKFSLLHLREVNVDHDHRCCSGRSPCGKCVNGLLCSRCNLGNFKDDPTLMMGHLLYLRRAGQDLANALRLVSAEIKEVERLNRKPLVPFYEDNNGWFDFTCTGHRYQQFNGYELEVDTYNLEPFDPYELEVAC